MTNWNYQNLTRNENPLAQESDFDILLENGGFLLVEDGNQIWGEDLRHTSTWSQLTKNNTTWASPTKN
jgi:hypothetical protein